MANGQLNLGKQSGGVLLVSFPDGVSNTEVVLPESGNIATKEETVDVYNSHIPMSNFASYHLIDGNLSVDNFVTTQGFNTTLYTGNGTTQSINTGIDMATQWGNDVSETFGGLVWIKSRSVAYNHNLQDTIQGVGYRLSSNSTASAQAVTTTLTSFNSNGFTVGSAGDTNASGHNIASWNFQTTHRVSGTTNHGKAYTEHYNPFTGFTIVKYEGSGIAGHEIPHHLGRKLGFITVKNLGNANQWLAQRDLSGSGKFMHLDSTSAEATANDLETTQTYDKIIFDSNSNVTNGVYQYILYGWANSYFDESNKLIGNYEIGVYQGTGASGNKVTTRGKPAWVMIKRLDGANDWLIFDNQRGIDEALSLYPNLSITEGNWDDTLISNNEDGFTIGDSHASFNASGGQYLYMVAYDTNANGGGTYYPKSTDNANVQVNNAIIPLAKGFDSNGAKNEIVVANETITGITYSEGKNYLYKTDSGYGVSKYSPQYNKSYNGFGDYYDEKTNKWYKDVAVFSDDFSDGNIDGWAAYNSVISYSNGLKVYDSANAGSYSSGYTSIQTEVGKKYKLVWKQTLDSQYGSYSFASTTPDFTGNITYDVGSVYGSNVVTRNFVATTTTTYIFMCVNNTGNIVFTDVSVIPLKDNGDIDLSNATEITESRNYMNHIVHADSQGNPLFVEELPKTEYKENMIINNLEVKGLNTGRVLVNVTNERFSSVEYINDTDMEIEVFITTNSTSSTGNIIGYVDGLYLSKAVSSSTVSKGYTIKLVVPIGSKYNINLSTWTIQSWIEFRKDN